MSTKQHQQFLEDFYAGRAIRAGEYLGSHLTANGAIFRVWAPNANQVFVSGDFNSWSADASPMNWLEGGIWELEIADINPAQSYKYVISSKDGQSLWKADPYAVYAELRPSSASRVLGIDDYVWNDEKWMKNRRKNTTYHSPINIYEVHLGSWVLGENGDYISYREVADKLIPYVNSMNFTHIEFMPLTEYPYDPSWGYQCTGYFAASSRYGSPQDLMYLIDSCHRAGIGVIMDWVPAHFPKDPHGLVEFDGARLYEDCDANMAEHPSWGTRIFDYGKGEVRSFLISSALFWLEKYHIDGLRVDAVASMLYLNYARENDNWRRNKYGGHENLDAVDFIRMLNAACFGFDESILMIAEESTAWPLVTAPTDIGGLGFNLKWNMGWMNDTLAYLKTDPYFRNGSHNNLTFSLMYAFSENFVIPLSHDEVVHMKGSLMGKAPGYKNQKMANVRAFWSYMLAHPGKKLLFMGTEFGQESEWNFAEQLPWHILQYPEHKQMHAFFKEANTFYKENRPLWNIDFDSEGFSWICANECDANTISFIRRDDKGKQLISLCSFSGGENNNFRLGVPGQGSYIVAFSTDSERFGGNGRLDEGTIFKTDKIPHHGMPYSILLDIPPLTSIFLRRTRPTSPQSTKSKTISSDK